MRVAFVNFRLPAKGTGGPDCGDYSEAPVTQRLTVSSRESAAEDDVYPRKYQVELRPWELSRVLSEQGLVQGHELGGVGLGDYQSLRSKMRQDAVETNESVGWPSLAQTRSMASVTRSGACRATYSARACLQT